MPVSKERRREDAPADRRKGFKFRFRFPGGLVAVIGTLVAIFVLFGYVIPSLFGFSLTNEDVQAVRDSAEVRLERAESLTVVIADREVVKDSIDRANDQLRARFTVDSARMIELRGSTRWHIKLAAALEDSLRAGQIDTIPALLGMIAEKDGAIISCMSGLTVCETQVATLNEMIENTVIQMSSDSSTIADLRVVNDDLATTLEDFLAKTNTCKYGRTSLVVVKFCNPSPTWTFLGGMVGGALLYAVVIDNGGSETVVIVQQPEPEEYESWRQ